MSKENLNENVKDENDQTQEVAEEAEIAPEETGKKGAKKAAKQSAKELDKLKKEVEQLKQQNDEYLNALKRERADFENHRKRNAQLSATSYANGAQDTALAILPAIDNLERAMATDTSDENFKTGVGMVLRQLLDTLTSIGVEEIDCSGKPFDPEYHNAVMQVEREEGQESGIVCEVLQKGYMYKDKVLRHSLVKVTN